MEESGEKSAENVETSRKRSRNDEEGDDDGGGQRQHAKVPDETSSSSSSSAAKRPNNNNNNNNSQSTVYFKVLVPSSSAGAIIGKGGETINQLQADTATNIKMSKGGDFFPGTVDRVCMIIGSVENVKKVHAFLLLKIKEKPDPNTIVNPNEVKTKVVVPNSTASLIIGKHGDFIKYITESTGAFLQMSPKSNDTEKPLSERIITVSGEAYACDKAIDLILEKIVEDPQSGACPNVSYTDGPILPQSTFASPNLTTSLHLPVTGHPTMEALKYVLRAKGYNEPATREITAAMYTLASYGFIVLRPPVMPQSNSQEWPSSEAGSGSEYYGQGGEVAAGAGSGPVSDAAGQAQDQQGNYGSYYNNYYNSGGGGGYGNSGYGNGYNAGGGGGGGGGGYDNSAGYANSNYNSYGNVGMHSGGGNMENMGGGMGGGSMHDMSGYSGQQGAYSNVGSGGYATGGDNYSMAGGNYSMGGGYPGNMGNYSSGGSSAPSGNTGSSTTQDVDIADYILQGIMGQEGRGVAELQQWCGVNIEVTQKAQYLHTARITGPQNSVQSAVYVIQQYIQQAEYSRRYYEGQAASNQAGVGHQ